MRRAPSDVVADIIEAAGRGQSEQQRVEHDTTLCNEGWIMPGKPFQDVSERWRDRVKVFPDEPSFKDLHITLKIWKKRD